METVARFVQNFEGVLAVGISWLAVGLAYWRKKRQWETRSFLQQVNFSLNLVREDTLCLRTLAEHTALDVWLSEVAVQEVLAAARRTTLEQPFLSLPNDDDMGYVKRGILNVLSQQFASAFVAEAVGGETERGEFVLGITCEKYGSVRTQKLRVMVIERSVLESRFVEGGHPTEVGLEVPQHSDRLTTLRIMAKLWCSEREEDRRRLVRMELGLPG